jgi:hypothetical protein
MKKHIDKIVRHVLEKKYPLFEDVSVIEEKNVFRYHKYGEPGIDYHVTLFIDFHPYLMNYIEIWDDIKDSIINTIKILGIDNTVKVLINFSDEK